MFGKKAMGATAALLNFRTGELRCRGGFSVGLLIMSVFAGLPQQDSFQSKSKRCCCAALMRRLEDVCDLG